MNEITIHGNLTDDPTLHHSPSGVAVPAYVAGEMQAAYTLAEGYRHDATLFAAHLATMPKDSPEYTQTLAEVQCAERMAADYTERARQLEEIHAARERWLETTEDAQLRHQLAGEELERRGAPLQSEPRPQLEQLALFDITHQHPAEPATAQAIEEDRALDPHQRTPEMGDQTEREPQPMAPPESAAEHQLAQGQLALFDIEATVEDRVQAQSLYQVQQDQERTEDAQLRITLAEARRQAHAADQLHHQRQAAQDTRAAEQARIAAAEMAAADRARRDQAEREAQARQQSQQQEQARQMDQPQIELAQTPHSGQEGD
jgi:hypothetical protein